MTSAVPPLARRLVDAWSTNLAAARRRRQPARPSSTRASSGWRRGTGRRAGPRRRPGSDGALLVAV